METTAIDLFVSRRVRARPSPGSVEIYWQCTLYLDIGRWVVTGHSRFCTTPPKLSPSPSSRLLSPKEPSPRRRSLCASRLTGSHATRPPTMVGPLERGRL